MQETRREREQRGPGRMFTALLVLAASVLGVWLISCTVGQPRSPQKDTGSPAAQRASSGAETGLLLLVSKAHPLPAGYTPVLTTVPIRYYINSKKDTHFNTRAAPYLTRMLDASQRNGTPLVISSGYRSGNYQKMNFQRKMESLLSSGLSEDAAQSMAADVVAPAGQSEHETGLAVDLVPPDWFKQHTELDASFDETPAFRWLVRHCADYGFILRYPKGKENLTGYIYEPWHYRFVGVEAAENIVRSGLCLEEYLQTTGSDSPSSG